MKTPTPPSSAAAPLSQTLPGSWRLISRIDEAADGTPRPEPMLGEDAVALLIYDRAGNFAAQFMRRDRSGAGPDERASGGVNNTQAQGGYDAYFGTYAVNDATGEVTQWLAGALSAASVGMVLTRVMEVRDDALVIRLDTTAADGTAVTRTLRWKRVG